jgi:hypothetical protein
VFGLEIITAGGGEKKFPFKIGGRERVKKMSEEKFHSSFPSNKKLVIKIN